MRTANCLVCEKPIPVRPYQAATARACSPTCAHALAVWEHPDLDLSALRKIEGTIGRPGLITDDPKVRS